MTGTLLANASVWAWELMNARGPLERGRRSRWKRKEAILDSVAGRKSFTKM
jgi:hypothetical protein